MVEGAAGLHGLLGQRAHAGGCLPGVEDPQLGAPHRGHACRAMVAMPEVRWTMLRAVRSAVSSERMRPRTRATSALGLDLLPVVREELDLDVRVHALEDAGEGVQAGEHEPLLGDELGGALSVRGDQGFGGDVTRRPEVLLQGERDEAIQEGIHVGHVSNRGQRRALAGAFLATVFFAGAFLRRGLLRRCLLGRGLLRRCLLGRGLLRRCLLGRGLLRRSLLGRGLLRRSLLRGGRLLRRRLLGRGLLRGAAFFAGAAFLAAAFFAGAFLAAGAFGAGAFGAGAFFSAETLTGEASGSAALVFTTPRAVPTLRSGFAGACSHPGFGVPDRMAVRRRPRRTPRRLLRTPRRPRSRRPAPRRHPPRP